MLRGFVCMKSEMCVFLCVSVAGEGDADLVYNVGMLDKRGGDLFLGIIWLYMRIMWPYVCRFKNACVVC